MTHRNFVAGHGAAVGVLIRGATLVVLLMLPGSPLGCGGGGGGGGGSAAPAEELALGAIYTDPPDFAAIPANDARLLYGSGDGRLPSRSDLRGLVPPVDSQRNAGSCVAWSTAYYAKTAVERLEEGWPIDTQTNQFSPAFIYNQRPNRTLQGDEPDGTRGGMQLDQAMDTLVSMGCCRWPAMPYTPLDSHSSPSAAAISEAEDFRARDYRRFGASGVQPPFVLTETVIDEIRGWLNDEGSPVSIAVAWHESMHVFRASGESDNVIQDVTGGQILGGHSLTIVGYDDNIPYSETGSFLIVNSHGLVWGDDGFAWVPFEEMKKIYWEGYGILDLPNGGAAPSPPPPQSNDVLAGASVIAAGSSVNGSIGDFDTDPADWWKFTAVAGSTATLNLTGLATDADLKLTDASENRLDVSQQWGTASESIVYTFATTGTYYAKVYPYDDAQSSYLLELSVVAGQGNDNATGATAVTRNADNLGSVGGSDPRDWWWVNLTAGEKLQVTLSDLSGDLDLYLYLPGGADGDWWLRSWKGGTASEALTFTAPTSGTYYLLVRPFFAASSGYTLRVDDVSSANLVLTSWNILYTSYTDRMEVTVQTLKVENTGAGTSPPFSVGLGLSTGTNAGASYWIGSETWSDSIGLPAGFVDTWSSGSGSISKLGKSAGYYHLLFKADSGNAVSEPNEFDNFLFSSNPFVEIK